MLDYLLAKMNLACWVTLSRLLLLPFALLTASLQWSYGSLVAAFICLLAGLSDILDGYLARRNNSTTTLGSALDPIVDKVFVAAMLLLLASRGAIPFWAPSIVILREVIISLLRVQRLQGRHPISADRWGKAKTVASMVAIIGLLLRQNVDQGGLLALASPVMPLAAIAELAWWILLVAIGLTLVSGANYFVSYTATYRQPKEMVPHH